MDEKVRFVSFVILFFRSSAFLCKKNVYFFAHRLFTFPIFFFSPSAPKEKEKEPEWADEESEVAHLLDDDFDAYLASNPSVLVMFYAPCK